MPSGPALTISDAVVRIRPRRQVDGVSCVLVSFRDDGQIDFNALSENLVRTSVAGLTPAVNMEIGGVHRMTPTERLQILRLTSDVLAGGSFVAGAYVPDQAGTNADRYNEAIEDIVRFGGVPIIMPSHLLRTLDSASLIGAFTEFAQHASAFIAYEADEKIVSDGGLFTPQELGELMCIPSLKGLRHVTWSRQLEWERVDLRDDLRPDFRIYSGNELATDMLMFGSDYFLSASACMPEAFGLRDRYWRLGDIRFYELNDAIQSLASIVFRPPFDAARHSIAQFLHIRGRIDSARIPPGGMSRPNADREILLQIHQRIERLIDQEIHQG